MGEGKKPCHAEVGEGRNHGRKGGEGKKARRGGGGRITMSRWFVCGPDLADRPNHTDNRPINIYPVAPRGIPDGPEVEHLAPWCAVQYNARRKTQGQTHRVGRVLSFFVVGIGTPPTPLAEGECAPHPLVRGGEGTLACGRGVGGVPVPTRGNTLWCSIYISTLWADPTIFVHQFGSFSVSACRFLIQHFVTVPNNWQNHRP